MEVVGFEVDGTRYGLEPQYARIFSQKLREFARGEYAGDLAEIKRRTELAAEWLDGAVPLADRVDRFRDFLNLADERSHGQMRALIATTGAALTPLLGEELGCEPQPRKPSAVRSTRRS